MANSDNVLHEGLMPKYIDVPEMMANVQFVSKPEDTLLIVPEQYDGALVFPIPVDDFAFLLYALMLAQDSAVVLFCVDSQATVDSDDRQCTLQPVAVFIASKDSSIIVSGSRHLTRVYNQSEWPPDEMLVNCYYIIVAWHGLRFRPCLFFVAFGVAGRTIGIVINYKDA